MFKYNAHRKLVLSTVSMGTILLASPALAQTSDSEAPVDDEIIVTGSILSAKSNENLVGVSVLTKEKLERHMSSSLGETLKFEPGISSSFFGPGASRPIIRGQGGLRILLLDNSISSIDASSASPDHAGAVEPAMASRIEVVRGSGLLRYGSAASGGVVNVIDGRIPNRVPDATFTGKARLGLSSVDNGREAAFGTDINLGKFGTGNLVAHGEAAYRKTDDYDIPGFARSKRLRALDPLPLNEEDRDTLPNSATKANTIAGGLSYIGQNMMIGGALKDLNSEYGIPGGEGSTIRLDQTRFDMNSQFDFAQGPFEKLTITGGYADYQHKEIEASGDVGTVFSNEGGEGRLELVQRANGNWQAAHGLQYKKRDFSAIGEESFVPPTTTTLIGAFTFHEFDFDKWHLEAAGRYEHVKHVDNANNTLDFDGLSASVGLDYHLADNLRLGGLFYRTARAPSSEELYSNGPHLATDQYERGNSNLKKEIASGAEISLRYKNGADYFTANVFYTDYADFVYEAFSGDVFVTDEGDELPISVFTPADAVFKGFEIALGKEIGSWNDWDFSLDGSVEYVNAELQSGASGPLPRIPPFGATFGLGAVSGDWDLRAEINHASAKDKIAAGELASDGYTLVNAYVTYHINDNMSFRVSLLNLGNEEARQHTSFLKDKLPLPGRNLKASLSVSF